MRDLMRQSERIRERAGKAYRAMRSTLVRQELQRESEQEIREALRAAGMEVAR